MNYVYLARVRGSARGAPHRILNAKMTTPHVEMQARGGGCQNLAGRGISSIPWNGENASLAVENAYHAVETVIEFIYANPVD